MTSFFVFDIVKKRFYIIFMDKDFLINLTNNLYHLTILFPKKEPLRYKMREVADDILDSFTRIKIHSNPSLETLDGVSQLLEELEVLYTFFAIAKEQNWVESDKLLSIWEDYSKIKHYAMELIEENSCNSLVEIRQEEREISEVVTQKEQVEKVKREPNGNYSSRHEKIVEFLKNNGKVQVGEFKKFFPEITKRTLRRDFRFLLKQGIIERMGERNDTFYRLCQSASPEPQQDEQTSQLI